MLTHEAASNCITAFDLTLISLLILPTICLSDTFGLGTKTGIVFLFDPQSTVGFYLKALHLRLSRVSSNVHSRQSAMFVSPDHFYLFPQLPAELRLAIWRYCLPYRISELDIPADQIVFRLDPGAPSPCNLWLTTYANGRPPVISYVCVESRAVAFETGSVLFYDETAPPEAWWHSGNSVTDPWHDRARDSLHVNWTAAYEADYQSYGSPIHHLAWEATRLSCSGSLMLDQLRFEAGCDMSPILKAMRKLSTWAVVMRVIVVHADFPTAVATGLFGLLGDARVQLVHISHARIHSFFDLAEDGERNYPVTVRQNLRRDWVGSAGQELQDVICKAFGSKISMPTMEPVVMFRLCTKMCNRVPTSQDASTTTGHTRAQIGRGSIRARGLTRGRGRGSS
jgi:hypothetical protein